MCTGEETRSHPLIGRSAECAGVDELLRRVRGGEGRALVIQGGRGIGKTALLEHATAAAGEFEIRRIVAPQSETEIPFAALHQLCRPMLASLERLPEPQREALSVAVGRSAGRAPDLFLVGVAVLGLLSELSGERPLLWVVDDAHWMDRSSAQILAFVVRRTSSHAVGILFATQRPVGVLAGLPTMRLGGIDTTSARRLLLSTLICPVDERVRERVIAEAHGSPLALLHFSSGVTPVQLAGGFDIVDPPLSATEPGETMTRFPDALRDDARRLLLLAAAEPLGDPVLLIRAGERAGISDSALEAIAGGWLEWGERVVFSDPLARAAVYRSAAPPERRDAHLALAEVTDRETDPDLRAWHLALSAAGPDERAAVELERSADRARARAGTAAAAALLQRAFELTVDPGKHLERAVAAARASLDSGAFEDARRLVEAAQAKAAGDADFAMIAMARAEIALAAGRTDQAMVLLQTAERVEQSNPRLAEAARLDAIFAALSTGRLARPDAGATEVAHALRSASRTPGATTPASVLVDGWATVFLDGCAAAAPALRALLDCLQGSAAQLRGLGLLRLATVTAAVLWDETAWEALSRRHVELAREGGALSELPLALTTSGLAHLLTGDLDAAAEVTEEARSVLAATGATHASWGDVALAALRGRRQDAQAGLELAIAEASTRGDGMSFTIMAWAQALLYNGLGQYEEAYPVARDAMHCPTNSAATAWGMVELVEAGARLGEFAVASDAAERFAAIADAAGTDWALGVKARLQGLLSDGASAEHLYRDSLSRLERCRRPVDLARTHLLYGEWLRRENRRVDARAHLRAARADFVAMGIEGFAERASRELLATGETPRKRTVDTRDDLTPQEHQIASLARDGLSNPEIGAKLFLSRRTVEWHLRHVFVKLGIQSRRELATVLPGADRDLAPA